MEGTKDLATRGRSYSKEESITRINEGENIY